MQLKKTIISALLIFKKCILFNSYSLVMHSLKMNWIWNFEYANKLSFKWTQIGGKSQLEKQSSEE